MAEKSVILSAEEEARLLKPIDEYVGKIQSQIDALRWDGSDKIRSQLQKRIRIYPKNSKIRLLQIAKKNWRKRKLSKMRTNRKSQV
mgnify:CR=1 FL=1